MKTKTKIISLSILLLLAVVGISSYFLFLKTDESPKDDNLFVFQNDYIDYLQSNLTGNESYEYKTCYDYDNEEEIKKVTEKYAPEEDFFTVDFLMDSQKRLSELNIAPINNKFGNNSKIYFHVLS